jgi:riboflavin kinase
LDARLVSITPPPSFTADFSLANLPDESIQAISSIARPGVYFGYGQVLPLKDDSASMPVQDAQVFPMVMSLGFNPFYKNKHLTAVSHGYLKNCTCLELWSLQEVHIMHEYPSDFYDHEMRAIVLGYIRPELDYTSRGMYTGNQPPIGFQPPFQRP